MKIGQRYEITWLDACFAWDREPGLGAPCQSVGWLVEQDEACIRLAFEAGPDGIKDGTRFHLDIPKSCILSRRKV